MTWRVIAPQFSLSTVREDMSQEIERCRVSSGMGDKSEMVGDHSLGEETHLFHG